MSILVGLLLIGAAASASIENPFPDSRIVGGVEASQGQFPYQAALQYASSGNFFCGGSWIARGDITSRTLYILTAAHCVEDLRSSTQKRSIRVVLGLHNKALYASESNAYRLTPSDIVVHPQYNSNTLVNDVAIITLVLRSGDPLVQDASFARPIELTTTGCTGGETSIVSGWGTLSSGGSTPNILNYVSKPVICLEDCKDTAYDPSWLLNSMMCSGEANKDACQGDSGGPLVATRNNAYVQIGVVSWGVGCGSHNYPGVYADVHYLRSWIIANSP